MPQNRAFTLARRPTGLPKREDWNYVREPVPAPVDGQLLVKVLYISLDPAMRGWMNEGRSYIQPVAIGEVMRAGAIGEVVESKHPDFRPGDHVSGIFGVQAYAISDGRAVTRVDAGLAPLPKFLSVLGMPGMTAYFGLLEIGRPEAGETVVVSAATGAVGSIVGQIASIRGCRTVGIAGGPDKCGYAVKELHYDACIDHKQGPVDSGLQQYCPKGIDVYFDNVGGDILDAVLARIRLHARIVICGAISQYNSTTGIQGPKNYLSLLINRARMEGMVVFDWADRYAEAARTMAGWMAAGKLNSREDIVDGLDSFPETLLKLFSGQNFGKLILHVDHSGP